MAIETKYVCDRCGLQEDAPTWMSHVEVRVQPVRVGGAYTYPTTSYPSSGAKVFCRNCCLKLGILGQPPVPLPKPEAIKTLDDQIREIIREELEDA